MLDEVTENAYSVVCCSEVMLVTHREVYQSPGLKRSLWPNDDAGSKCWCSSFSHMHILECYVKVILFIIHTSALHRTHATLFGTSVFLCSMVSPGLVSEKSEVSLRHLVHSISDPTTHGEWGCCKWLSNTVVSIQRWWAWKGTNNVWLETRTIISRLHIDSGNQWRNITACCWNPIWTGF